MEKWYRDVQSFNIPSLLLAWEKLHFTLIFPSDSISCFDSSLVISYLTGTRGQVEHKCAKKVQSHGLLAATLGSKAKR